MADVVIETSEKYKGIKKLDELIARIREYHPTADISVIEKAYQISEEAHRGQIRRSGEAYISHPLNVAAILTELRLDLVTVAAGLLHDTVEDTKVTLADIEKELGPDVAQLVDGVTKISQIKFSSTHAKQGENIRKMIVAMGKDIRVILVKLADRLHNMRTLNHMSYEKQQRIAQETLDIYAPLSGRLGVNKWKIELEDLSFRYVKPDAYYDLVQKVSRKKKEREKYIEEVIEILKQNMAQVNITCDVQGRPKHLYSIYKKMVARNIDYDQIYDVLAFRILTQTLSQCYEALGIVHSLYKPVPGRFKDFIAMPKANNYRSLHTTVIGPMAEQIEIQIRTEEMHQIAERGIAAHWKYKEKGGVDQQTEKKFNWLRELVDWHKQMRDPDEFLETVKNDLFESEIYVFTPKGEVKELPEGATPLDFAYSIHTDVGSKTVGAKINGKIVPLKHRLRNGDRVEILTSPTQTPNKDWLKICVTSRAQSKIRSHIMAEERKRAIQIGQDILEKDLKKVASNVESLKKTSGFEKFLKDAGAKDIQDVYMLVGYGKLLPEKIIEKLLPEAKPVVETEETFLGKVFKKALNKKKNESMIKVSGATDILVRYARCCSPIPGDPIIGFISRGRGVTVHQASCPKAYQVSGERRIDVEWTNTSAGVHHTKIKVISIDTPGLLKQMSETFTNNGVNIANAQIRTTRDNKGVCIFHVTVKDTKQVLKVMSDLQKIKGIIDVQRTA